LELLVFLQTLRPELREHAGFLPFLKAAVGRTLFAEVRLVQRLPLAAGPEHKQNGIHRGPIRHARVVAPQWVRLPRREQRLDPAPECIGNAPAIVIGYYHRHGELLS